METKDGQLKLAGSDKKETPPTIITLESKGQQKKEEQDDTASKKSDSSEKRDEISFRQARTPKHTNKTMSLTELEKQEDDGKPRELYYPGGPSGGGPHTSYPSSTFDTREQPMQQQYMPSHYDGGQRLPHPNDGTDYLPRDNSFYNNRTRTMPTVSPGGADAQYRNYYPPMPSSRGIAEPDYPMRNGPSYGQVPPRYENFRPPPRGEYRVYDHPQQFEYNTGGPSTFPPNVQYNRAYPPREEYRGGNPAAYRPPYVPRDYQQRHTPNDGRYPEHAGPVSRAVSSSFDRSIKSRDEVAIHNRANMDYHPHYPPPAQDTSVGGASDDSSWHKLNQVASIDDAAIQERLSGNTLRNSKEPTSTSSSLTNSPSDDHKIPLPTPSKLAALDSLSSVASGQEPIDTKVGSPSPGSSTTSLDLMKCHSGSSGLLHGFLAPLHSRDMSNGSLQIPVEYRLDAKRSREGRCDANTSETTAMDIRRAPSGEGHKPPLAKKPKFDQDSTQSQSLGLDCSPPRSPSRDAQREGGRGRSLQQGYSFNSSPGQNYFDKPPVHNYSMDSRGRGGYPLMRPGSSTSSTATPHEGPRDTIGPALPSWDLQAQDSFGNTSGGGGQVMSNFSFSNDYPMLSGSGSNLERPPSIHSTSELTQQQRNGPPHLSRHPVGPHIETRNQSFEGGNFHGSFGRVDTIDGVYRRNGPPPLGYAEQRNFKHQGQFLPHVPSWGTSQSVGPQANGSQYPGPLPPYNHFNPRNGPPPNQRSPHRGVYGGSNNFAEDSGAQSSPPLAHMIGRNHFAPPPEFSAPQNSHLARRPPPAVYIMSTNGGGPPPDSNAIAQARAGTGVYSWTKEEDHRLTEVMKKHKNPRDWEPIAKEHGRGKRYVFFVEHCLLIVAYCVAKTSPSTVQCQGMPRAMDSLFEARCPQRTVARS